MALCGLCGREMNEAVGCVPHSVLLEDGRVVSAPEHGPGGSLGPSKRCHDCGAREGGIHHPRCDIARVPGTGRQLMMEAVEYARTIGGPDPEFDFSGGDR